jgi:flagellar hook-associated protein 2
LRSELFQSFEDSGLTPAQIGLSTGDWRSGGRIVLNEDRLRSALENPNIGPERINDVFNSTEGRQGLTWRMDNIMGNFVNGAGRRSLRSLEQSVQRENERIERLEMRMWREEERLHRQFAAMEAAMGQMQQQGDWFASMLGGL